MRDGADSSDEDLMLAYAAGDAAAFDTIYARHKGGVFRYLLRQCRDAGVAEQLFQDVWMNLIRVRATYRVSARFTTWLYTLAHNRLVDHHRASGRVTLLSADDEAPRRDRHRAARKPQVRTGIACCESRDRRATRGMRSLHCRPPSGMRSCCNRRAASRSKKSPPLTGVGAETVKSRLRYATAKLRTELADLRQELREDTR